MKWKTCYRSCARRSSSQRDIRAKAAPGNCGGGNGGELRSAPALRSILTLAEKKNVRRIISFHNFKSTPSARILAAKASEARSHGANIFKVVTRTDTPIELGRLVEFMTSRPLDLAVAVMGIGKLGAISRVLLARAGSVLIYASIGAATDVEGQLSLEQLRALGFGP